MKINGTEIVSNGKFAWDECHKIYILEDKYDESDAIERQFCILPIDKLEETWNKSCPLRFIRTWKLKSIVPQFEDAVFTD